MVTVYRNRRRDGVDTMASFFESADLQAAEEVEQQQQEQQQQPPEDDPPEDHYASIPPQASESSSDDDDDVSFDKENSTMAPRGRKKPAPKEPFVMEEGDGAAKLLETCGGTFEPEFAESTNKQRKAIKKQWIEFHKTIGVDAEADGTPFLLKMKEDPYEVSDEVNWRLVHDFAHYFINGTHGGDITWPKWKTFLDTTQYWVKTNCVENSFNEKKFVGIIRNDRAIQSLSKKIVRDKAKKMDVEHPDIHRHLIRRTNKNQRLSFIDMCLAPSDPTIGRLNMLMRTQVAVAQLVSACTLQRSEHIVGLTYKFSMVRNIEHLGPDGTDCDIVVANKGKSNTSGHVEVRGIPPHMKNQMDASAMMGVLLVLRHSILGETFPDFLSYADHNPESFVKRFLLRGMNNYRKPVNADDFRKAWSAINHACGILVEKVTHQNRIEIGESAMDRKCSSTTTERLFGHQQPGEDKKMNNAQKKSYTLLPPAEGLAAVGGGDPQNPSDYLPLWSTVTEGTEEAMRLVAPWFYSKSDLVNVKIDEIQSKNCAKSAYNMMQEDRLFMARGALDSIELRLRRFLQVAACRPVNGKGILQFDSPPNYVRWGSHPVFQHMVFQSECFRRLVQKMKEVQDDEANLHVDLTVPCKNEVERVVKHMVAQPLNSHSAAVNSMSARLGNIESTLQNLLAASTPPTTAAAARPTRAASPAFSPSPARALRFPVAPTANQATPSPAPPAVSQFEN